MKRKYPSKTGLVTFTLLLSFASCKKSDPSIEKSNPISQREAKIKGNLDSLYQYAQQIYLWNEQLPALESFKPDRFFDSSTANEIDLYKNEIFAFSRFAVNPVNNIPFEYLSPNPGRTKYSSLIEIGAVSSGSKTINTSDNNFGLAFAGTADNQIRVLYVDPNSSAGIAGLKRGQKVININGKKAEASADYYNLISAALNDPGLAITVETVQDNPSSAKTYQLSNRPYTTNPVLKSVILEENAKKIGYISYRSFTAEDNSRQYLDPIFGQFAAADVAELIIDLRYNSGGYQNTSKYLANKIIPQSANGQLMFTEIYNKLMQNGKANLLANQPLLGYGNEPIYVNGKIATLMDIDYSPGGNKNLFEKEGPLLHVKKVSFIVSSQTASASELLINVLKPYLDVKIVGVSADGNTAVRTYGKPVGFFDIKIDKYKVYLAMYQDKNANNEGDFYEGMPAEISTADDTTVDFGDTNDPALRAIVSGITTAVSGNKRTNSSGTVQNNKYILPVNQLNGLIKTSFKFKPMLKQ
ncbi:hypothetical protein H7F33_05860 [Pedobacter sp. PAMC26386]|nr:hypothetical protein H7F33_05860 [Pedobacter sp. PAMC26386]